MGISFRFFRFIRRHIRPIEPNKALRWKNRLNLMYIFFAWNAAGGIIMYYTFGAGKDVKMRDNSAESWAKFLKIPNTINIVRMKGLTPVESYQYVVPLEEEQKETQQDAELMSN